MRPVRDHPNEIYLNIHPAGIKRTIKETEEEVLSPEEVQQHRDEVASAILTELQTWQKYQCFSRRRRDQARNIIDCRWVFKWKFVDVKTPEGKTVTRRTIRARLTVRGFKDQGKGEVASYAGTSSRLSQRILVSEAVCNK